MNNFLKSFLKQSGNSKYEFGSFDDSRVNLDPNPPHQGDGVRIHYQGLLKNCGAQEIYLHYGFDNWNSEVATVKMERQYDGGFAAAVPAHHHDHRELNYCFKDSANHWDNNNGSNWTAPFH